MKVLITDKVHPVLIASLSDKGYGVEYNTEITLKELPQYLPDLTGIIINSKIIMDRAMIDLGTKLKFIGRLGSGMEIIDRQYAESKGIVVVNSPEGNRDSVAEHAIGMLLAWANHIIRANNEVKTFVWHREANRGYELMGKRIGIIGFGNTGWSLAKKLSSWDMHIVYHDKYPENLGSYAKTYTRVDLEDILETCDIISLHLPLTKETFHYVNDDFVSRCKDGVVIINTSRGRVTDTTSLIKGLMTGKIAGLCLDVFENENPSSYTEEERSQYEQLFSFEEVIVSPHVAGWTKESLEKIASYIVKKLEVNGL